MRKGFIAFVCVALIYLTLMFISYGPSTVFKCGAIESIPVGDQRCWNLITGLIDLEEE